MHLSTLRLQDVRQFEDQTFEFHPGFNLLVGVNGSGKTTMLKAILATLGESQRAGHNLKFQADDIRLRSNLSSVEARVDSLDNQTKKFYFKKPLLGRASRAPRKALKPLILSYASNEAISRSMKQRKIRSYKEFSQDNVQIEQEALYYGFNVPSESDTVDSTNKKFGNSRQVRGFIGKIFSRFSDDFKDFMWRFEPYSYALITQKSHPLAYPVDAEIKKQIETTLMRFFQENNALENKNYINWPDLDEVILGRPSKNQTIEKLNSMYRRALSELDLPTDTKDELYHSQVRVKLTPRIVIMRSVGPLGLHQLSDGEKRLFSIFVDIARELSLQHGISKKIGDGEAIVLIDEIDVHLHPKWQRQIVPLLEEMFQNCQFIATTHSPFVIQSVQSESNLLLLNGLPLSQLGNTGIEKITQVVMEVDKPQVSTRYSEAVELSKSFLQLLDEANKAPKEKLEEYISRLGEKLAHAQNPAMQAFLELQQEARLD